MSIAALETNLEASVRDHVDDRARHSPDRAFLIDPTNGKALTFLQAQQQVRNIAHGISSKGIAQGETVAYAFSNSPDAVLSILAILYGGYVATAINLVAGDATIAYVLDHSDVRLVIVDEQTRPKIELLAKQSGRKIEIATHREVALANLCDPLPNSVSGDLNGLLMYTSGTTGRPKGVLLSQSSLLAGGQNAALAHQLGADDCGLCVLPLYHINAFCVSLMGSLVSGSALVLPAKFSVSSFWDTIRNHHCSWFSVVPTQISYLLHNIDNPGGTSDGCDRLRFGRSASAPLSPEMHQHFESQFNVPIIETMGLTETSAQILSNPLPPGARKIGSPGVAFGNEVMIADLAQNPLSNGEEGEILVRGPNLLKGYLKNEPATREAITSDGWFRTGDLGRMDDDGYVFVTGRLKELIIKGGENIAPREIDEALYSHPDIIEAAAFAVACEQYGQRVKAAVKVRKDAKIPESDLLELCRMKVGDFKCPDAIYFLDELPKGPSGKIQRNKLQDLIAS